MLPLAKQTEQGLVAKQKIKGLVSVFTYTLASAIIALALISFVTDMFVEDIITWITENFGLTFSVLFSALLVCACFAIAKIWRQESINFWAQVGAQSANAISTLALTFTLLGISLGIGALSEQSLSPENVDEVITILTSQFSIAFMTTVVGLPAATAVRACVAILVAKHLTRK